MGKHKDKDKDRKKDKHNKRKREDDEDKQRKEAAKLVKRLEGHVKRKAAMSTEDATGGGGFFWAKKHERDFAQGKATIKDFSKAEQEKKRREQQEEIIKVQKRREEREAEKERMEEEKQFLQRERAIAEGLELDKKEEQFHLDQAKMRTQQRLREGRAKPIDRIVQHLYFPDDFDGEASIDPYEECRSLQLPDLRQLRDDVENLQELDKYEPQHVEFWGAMAAVVAHELGEAVRQEEIDRARVRGEAPKPHLLRRDAGVHPSFEADVSAMLAGKTYRELVQMEEGITDQLDSGSFADPEYWTAVLSRLSIWKQRAQLRELHADILASHIAAVEAKVDVRAEMGWDHEQEEETEPASPSRREPSAEPAAEPAAESPADEEEDAALERLAQPPGDAGGAAAAAAAAWQSESEEEREENVGQWSPKPLEAAMVVGQDVIHEDDDARLLDLLRAQVKHKEAAKYRLAAAAAGGAHPSDGDRAYQQMVSDPSSQHGGVHPMMRNLTDAAPQTGEQAFRSGQNAEPETAADRVFRSQAARLMDREGDPGADVAFGGEVQLESQVYWWHEKYRPRKPKYFNRVHTGYEWNKYNQTHYDHDNPPPKVVQGYKFNIFYPDLIDKSEAPTYQCEEDPHAVEGATCMLRFHAGPPYEDLAFRIVNKEWEYSHKRGFKSTFERGILHLYFNFKRARYRR